MVLALETAQEPGPHTYKDISGTYPNGDLLAWRRKHSERPPSEGLGVKGPERAPPPLRLTQAPSSPVNRVWLTHWTHTLIPARFQHEVREPHN